ncbi:hypothetical protein EDD21DRAFT_179734 [Dissophora ornata]|nr:hypothetical protein EDD21DRAFT_179734 [Dissophora ornata]
MPPLLLQIRDALSVFTLPPFLDRLFGPPPYTASATTATSKVTVAATPTGATLSEMTVVASQSPLPCRSPWSFLSLYTPLALYPLENEAITKTQTGSSFRRRSLATVSYPTPSSSSDAVCYSSSLSHGSSISPGEPSLSSYASSTSTEPIGRATLPPSGPTPQHCNFLPSPPASPPQTLVQTREARAESSVHSPQPQPSQVPKSQTYHHQLQPQPGGHYHQRQQQPLPCYTNDLGPRANKTKWNKNGHTNERVLKFLAYVEDIETIPEDVKYWHDDTHFIIKDRFPKVKKKYAF